MARIKKKSIFDFSSKEEVEEEIKNFYAILKKDANLRRLFKVLAEM
ncbi:MAG: hypothetical protein QXL47_01395 [Candidatus Anstonellales archaeon]